MPKRTAPGPIPQDALDYFTAKKLEVGFDFRDVWREEHVFNFTVAKMGELDLLKDVQDSITAVLAEGKTFRQWAEEITPELQQRGWWGIKERVDPQTGEKRLVQLGSPRRLKTIYDANLRTARAAGQWQRIQRTKETHPYLLYQLGPSEHHRPEHVAWHGLLLPVDHPFWATHMPINGWGCKCWVRQVSRREYDELQAEGFQDPLAPMELDDKGRPTGRRITQKRPVQTTAPKIQYRKWVNKRTGEIERVPVGIDPGWDTNPGLLRHETLLQQLGGKAAAAGPALAGPVLADHIRGGLARWLKAPEGRFPMAVLPAPDAALIGAGDRARTAWMNAGIAAKQLRNHGELGAEDYARAQDAIDTGERIQDTDHSLIYILNEAGGAVTIVEYDLEENEIMMPSFRRLSSKDKKREREVERLRQKGRDWEAAQKQE